MPLKLGPSHPPLKPQKAVRYNLKICHSEEQLLQGISLICFTDKNRHVIASLQVFVLKHLLKQKITSWFQTQIKHGCTHDATPRNGYTPCTTPR